MASSDGTPRPFLLLSTATALSAVLVTLLTVRAMPVPLVAALPLLIAAILLSENYALELPRVGSASLSYPLTIATAVLLGPSAAAVASAFSGFNFADIRGRRPLPILLYNTGQVVICSTLSAWLYVWLGGRVLVTSSSSGYSYVPLQTADFPGVIAALGVAALAGFALNAVLLGVGWYFYRGSSPVQVLREVLWMVPTQMALAAVGLTIAQVLSISYLGFVLFVFPLLVARGVYRHYVELRTAFNDTIRFFVGFLEAKDPYTRGHSERVAAYAVEIGEAVGLSPKQTEDLEYAALLHDMGKLRVPKSVLTKPGKLDSAEFDLIRKHPTSGAEIVLRIPYLKHLAGLVRSHHESFDGSGYCDGLRGEDIPVLSRVLTVADSYDAMTTARPYRRAMTEQEAFDELQACSGSQFDPGIVAAWRARRIHDPELEVRITVEHSAAGGAE